MNKEFDLHRCSLPDLAKEMQHRFEALNDSRSIVPCDCGDWCECWGDTYSIEMSDFRNLEETIIEFVRRMK